MYIELAKHELLKVSPYFGHLLQTVDIAEISGPPMNLEHLFKENPALEHAGCFVYGNGDRWTITFREDVVCYWHPEQRVGALAHELLHLVIEGHNRIGDRQAMYWNVAQDLVINSMLSDTGFMLPDEALFPKHLDMQNGCTAESYYDQIEKKGGKGGDGDGAGAQGFDAGVSGSVDSQAERRLAKAGQRFAKDAQKVRGLESLAIDLPDEEPTGSTPADWRDVLHDAIRSCLALEHGSSFAKYGAMSARQAGVGYGPGCPRLPSWFKREYDVAVAIDTSGSMFGELSQLRAEVEAICETAAGGSVRLIQCDAAVAEDTTHRKGQAIKMKGGGGTSFVPVFRTIDQGKRPDLLVYLTDGYGDFPSYAPGYPVVWGAVGDISNNAFPFGKVVRCGGNGGT